jgi:hypothetical protein
MKKARAKLALRKETLRALSNMDLAHATGGQDTDVVLAADATFDKACPAAAVIPKG